MKNMKKLFSLLLALVMVLGLAVSANAADGDQYEIYQIFTADLTEKEGTTVMSNVKWGKNGTGTEGDAVDEATLSALTAVNSAATDSAKLDVILDYADLDNDPFTTGSGTTYELDNGYYLVKNVDGSQEGENDFYTLYVVEVVNGSLTITPKGDVPEVEKEVSDPDVSIGETVTYTLTATMPSTFDGYDKYKVIFTDTMSEGLTYGNITSVTVNDNAVTSGYVADCEDGVLTVTFNDVLSIGATASSTIVVEYTATVNSNAVIGADGNENAVKLTYSNDPNWDGKGDEPTGDTPEDEVKVYTWEIPVFKYTGTDTPLAGAGFTLYTDADCTAPVDLHATDNVTIFKACTDTTCTDTHVTDNEIVTDNNGRFKIQGLQMGTYYLKETTTPDGYNTCGVVTVVIGENGALTQNGTTTTEVTIQNNQGSTLPSTGGMGTTMIYTIGGILVVAAVVLLVTKKRMAR